jgi:isocitrate dehydrogenase kinase/phosphatase
MADTLEYSNVAFPRHRFTDDLVDELKHFAPSLVEEDGEQLIIKHLYIERRMVPLNIWLGNAEKENDEVQLEHGIVEYGNAIKELVAANIFPGDMLYKNFGVTRHQRVVFYDYDEIEYITDCQFRAIPQARTEEEEMASEPWYPIGKSDVFPEQFGASCSVIRASAITHETPRRPAHARILAGAQAAHQQGIVEDVFPYPQYIRFCNQHTQPRR